MNFLVDTNVYIRAFSGKEPDATFLKRIVRKKGIILSPIVLAEFLPRALKEEQKLFEEIIHSFPMIPIDEHTGRLASHYRKASLQTSKIRLLDCFLVAQCKQHNLTLATNNRTDFTMKDIQVISPR